MGEADYNLRQDNVETTIPVFPLTVEGGASEVSGIAWAELDLTNDEPEFAEGAIVRASIMVNDALAPYNVDLGSGKGDIGVASYSNFVLTDTVGADGRYSLIIPNGNANNGAGINANVEFLPFEAKQKYVAWQGDSLAVVTKNVIFGSGASAGGHLDTDLPSVYVEIGAPTGSASGFELEAVAMRTPFDEYSWAGLLEDGSGYEVGDVFTFSEDADGNAATIVVDDVDEETGAILDWDLFDNDATYDTEPSLVQGEAVEGTGAKFKVFFMTEYQIKVKNQGSGYWEVPEVSYYYDRYDEGITLETIGRDLYLEEDAWAIDGKIYVDGMDDEIVDVVVSATTPRITILPLKTRQAVIPLGSYAINDDGQIEASMMMARLMEPGFSKFEILLEEETQGNGYMTPPTVTFKSAGSMGSGAEGVASVRNGKIEKIVITNPGSGYKSLANNITYEEVPATAEQSASPVVKTGGSTPNYNYSFGLGSLKQ